MKETMTVSQQIVELFETLLDEKNIDIPCADAIEESNRYRDGNTARLYGMEYWNLVDGIQNILNEK